MNGSSVSTSLQPGYILHYREYQESSFIVDAFCLTHGRVSLFARSARQSRPQVRALYQPFRPLLISWVGSGELRTLTGIEDSGNVHELKDVRLACGYYINEIVLRLLGKDQPNDPVFAYYALALSELEQNELNYEAVLRTFELQLLDTLAVLPDFRHCLLEGASVQPELEYTYYPANAIALPAQETQTHGLLKKRHVLPEKMVSASGTVVHPDGITEDKGIQVQGKTLIALQDLDFSDREVIAECRPLMKQILREQLGDKPLRSRELFAALAPAKPDVQSGSAADT